MKNIILFAATLLIFQTALCQDFVIDIKGDTIFGQVKPITYGAEKRVVVVQENKSKNNIPILKTKMFRYKGSDYQPVRMPSGYVFMKVIKRGYLSLFAYQLENQTNYDGLFLQKADGESMTVPNLGFKKLLSQFVEECPVVKEKISEGVLGRNEVHSIIDEYNACIDNRSNKTNSEIAKGDTVSGQSIEWKELETAVANDATLAQREDAVEMLGELHRKIDRKEKVPNFLIEGLKEILAGSSHADQLRKLLSASGL